MTPSGGPGAVYVVGAPLGVAVEETDPQLVPLQVMLQATPLPDESLLRVALNCAVACGCTVAEVGDIVTLIAGGGGGAVLVELPPQPKLLLLRIAQRMICKIGIQFFGFITHPPKALRSLHH